MENKNNGGLFRALLAAAFMIGTAVYIFAIAYTDGVLSKIGFGLLAAFSLLAGIGVSMTDMSATVSYRFSTKLAAFLFPFSINCGALAVEILMVRDLDKWALAAAGSAALIAVICSSSLVMRYREDDF